MLRSLAKLPRSSTAQHKSFPAATKGWNARDSIADMDPAFAILMDNFFPTPSDVMLRKGWTEHATGFPDFVETVMAYNSATSADRKMFGISGTDIYDATAAGAIGAADVSGLTNARWQHINFATSAGQFLLLVNAVDTGRMYDTAGGWANWTVTGTSTAVWANLNAFKNRVWAVERNSLNAWYLNTDAITGTATKFPLTGVFKKGGFLQAMATWTIDAGEGVDDHAVFVTNEGEVAVYKGTDPSSASTFALVGVWSLGQPIGRRCFAKLGGDICLILKDGVVPLSRALQSDRMNPKIALTDNIQQAMSDAANLYGNNFGWQLLLYPKGTMMILNVPVAENDQQQQYAMNTINGAWGRFKNIEANCWELFNDDPYFGGENYIGKFWDTFSDNDTNVEGQIKQAFNYFGDRGTSKFWKRGRPIFASNGQPAIAIGLNTDFRDEEPSGTLTFTPTTYAIWDTSLWDVGIWGGGLNALTNWQQLSGYGKCAALRIKAACKGLEVRHQATDYVFDKAPGVL